MPAARKTGKLSSWAEQYIRENSEKIKPEEIAITIGKTPDTVNRYIARHNLVPYGEEYNERVRRKLKESLHLEGFWRGVKDNYSKDEIKIFEDLWVDLIQQFDEDVTATEKLQMHKYITLILMRERIIKKQTLFQNTLESVTDTLNSEKKKHPDDRNDALVDKLATTVQSLTKESSSLAKEYTEVAKQESEMEKALKGTRDQRVKQIQDATKNWSSLLQQLESPKLRREIGAHLEIHRRAADKAKADISAPHQYLNKEVDLPLLTSETVESLNLEDE